MLLQIHIQNYAIIEEIAVDFTKGLQVITGETGAGKSIIAGALSLVLGDRADTSVLKNRNQKAVIEARFDVHHIREVELFLVKEELDREEELLMRREISPNGKTRAFINDTPVNLEQLRKISSLLVDLHQQFDILSLGEAGFQLAVVDALAANSNLRSLYRKTFSQLKENRKTLEELKSRQALADKENDYNHYLFNELEEASLKENEFEESEILLKRQSHSEAIKSLLTSIIDQMQQSEQPIVQQIRFFSQQLEPYRAYHEKFPEILQRFASLHIEMQDLAGEIESVNDEIQFDPGQIEKLNERLHIGYKLFKKHRVSTTTELISLREQLGSRLSDTLHVAEEINAREKNIEILIKEATGIALQLSKTRKAETGVLEEKVNLLLGKVGMPNAVLKVVCNNMPLNEEGIDQIEFLFDANKSGRFEPLKKVASGGELSRLMLCIKSLVARSMDMPTLLFDEIDTGISGEAARQVGMILKELSKKRQVICITHQPQIAGKGDAHFYVYKEVEAGSVNTKIRLLDGESRILVIAKMLSGEKPTAAAMENARELVN